jgi:hypothetical protein
MSSLSSQRTSGIGSPHTTSFSHLKVSNLRKAEAMFRGLHDQSTRQEALHWHRLRLLHGNTAVRLVVKTSWYHLCDPVVVASCNFTASQKMVNPDVMRKMQEKLDYFWNVCKVNKWTHIQDPYISFIIVAMQLWLTLVLRNTLSKHTTKIINRGEWKPKSCQKKNVVSVSNSERIRTLWATFGLTPEPCRSKVPVMNQKLLASENWLTR